MATRLSAPRLGSTACRQHQPDSRVNLKHTAGPGTDDDLALGRVRAGDSQLDFRPARQLASQLVNHAGLLATTRGGDSCRPTLGEPAALCQTQFDDEAS